jgi:signal transduction histidine kinase
MPSDSQLLSQLLLTGVPGAELDSATAARLKKLQPGGYILFGRNIQSPEQLRKLIDDLRDLAARAPRLTRLIEARSIFGHDAFLKERELIGRALHDALLPLTLRTGIAA